MSEHAEPCALRIGHGYDVHRFADAAEAGATITLCGQAIPHGRRLLAHSDGDVALHAVCDALLGAIGAGDIGRHFPDDDPAWKGVDSSRLLEQVYKLVRERGYRLANVDITVIAQAPRLAPWIDAMRNTLASKLGVAPECSNVKATTTERLGFAGREEGIAAHAVVIIYKKGLNKSEM